MVNLKDVPGKPGLLGIPDQEGATRNLSFIDYSTLP